MLIFSDSNATCGALCDSNREKRSGSVNRSGWTKSYISTDTPKGTGDHEHYYEYIGKPLSDRLVYDSNGNSYINCEKKAIQVRSRELGENWLHLVKKYTLEWMAILDAVFFA